MTFLLLLLLLLPLVVLPPLPPHFHPTHPPAQDGDFGRHRLWASVGWGGCSLAAGALISHVGMEAVFPLYALLALPLTYIASQLRFKQPKQQQQQQQQQQQGDTVADVVKSPVQLHAQVASSRPKHPQKQQVDLAPHAYEDDTLHLDQANMHKHRGRDSQLEGALSSHQAGTETAAHHVPTPSNTNPPQGPTAGVPAVSTSSNSNHSLRQLLKDPSTLVLLARCVLMGFGAGVIGSYEFLYLTQLGAPETLIGAALLVGAGGVVTGCCRPHFSLCPSVLQQHPCVHSAPGLHVYD